MAYKKQVKQAFNFGAKSGTTDKKRKDIKAGNAIGKKISNGVGKFAVKGGIKNIKRGVKLKNKKLVKSGVKTVVGGVKLRAQGAGLRTAIKAGVAGGRVYRMTAAHKKAISDALKGKKRG
jgi:hypothetical protein